MSFNFQCPFCEQNLLCLNENENTVMQCPNCGNDIVPERNAEPAPEFVHVVEMPKAEEPKPEIKDSVPEKEEEKPEQKEESIQTSTNYEDIYTNDEGKFKQPFAAEMFHYSGIASMTIAIISFVIMFALSNDGKQIHAAISCVVFISTISSAYFSFAISQIITCTAKNAYNTDKTVAILEKLEEHLSEKETKK